ncbi:MAG: hypothetical protein ACXVZ2_15140, partial [Gaiellaceae bacterium]
FVARAPFGDPASRLRSVRPLADEPFRPARRMRPGGEELRDDALDRGIELRRDGKPTEVMPVEPVDSYQLELENLSDAIQGEASPLLGRADAMGLARAIDGLYRSADSGERVELSP